MDVKYKLLTPGLIASLSAIVGEEHVLQDEEALARYSHDETEDLRYLPEVVLKPQTVEEVSRIMHFCNQHCVPVTPRGAGTGLSGGALPVHKGVVLSMERFNKIIEIDERNLQATVEPGVITEAFQMAAAEKGLFYPPDPASKGSCFLGGNLSQSSGGPRAVKYGTTRDYVLNIQVVLPTGDIIWTGANVLKYASGYNLTHLMIGSEGTLGIITKIVFRLIPLPRTNLVLLVPFKSAEEACAAVSRVFMAGLVPSGMEFMEREALVWACRYLDLPLTVADDIQAHLLIELDGNDMDLLYKQAEELYEVLQQFDTGEVLMADTAQQKEDLWRLRRNVAHAVKKTSVYKEEDTVVPRAELPALLKGVKEIGSRYGFQSVCYGHAGDGNLHVNIVKGNMSEEAWKGEQLVKGIREIFELVVKLGGTISGEHGIGLVQKQYLPIALQEVQLNLMRGIKQVFDPNGILNPGKIF